MIVSKTKFSNIASDCYLRCDEKYHSVESLCSYNIFGIPVEKQISLSDVIEECYLTFDYEEGRIYKGIPTGQTYIDEDGDIIDYQPVSLNDHPDRLKYALTNNLILISSLRLARSPALLFENFNLEEFVFSNGFYCFSVKAGWEKKYVLYLLRLKKLKSIIDNNIYRGIGISTYKVKDLLRIPVRQLSKQEQIDTIKSINPIEKKIAVLKKRKHSIKTIIDTVFQRRFGLDFQDYIQIEKRKNIKIANVSLAKSNSTLRLSYRWNKSVAFQDLITKKIECSTYLGHHIVSVKNGWSPVCNDSENGYRILGIDAISNSGELSFDNPKYSSMEKSDLSSYYVRDQDFFVSRGNTVDLVALAAVANIKEDDNQDVIYPDLMIRINFDNYVNKKYMAYVFNSFIGRCYFKYCTKGKNQTMVKVSLKELRDFVVPLPNLAIQQSIVDEIRKEINEQQRIKKEIAVLREQIDEIIIRSISA